MRSSIVFSSLGSSLPWSLSLVSLALLACSSSGSIPPSATTDASSEPDASTLAPGDFQVEFGPVTVPPGTEKVQCVIVRLGNDVPVKIHEIENILGSVSHHYIIYLTPETDERPEPHDCESIQNLINPETGQPLMITQKYEETLTLPEGVAFELEANQMLRLELHYINASDQPLDVHVSSTFRSIAEADYQYPADFLFVGNPDVRIPGNSTATLGPSYLPLGVEFADVNFFGFTGHQHQYGTNVYVTMAESESGPEIPVYDLPNFNWDEPETVFYDPPLSFPYGGGFRFTCDWNNTSSQTVWFGEGVNDEMCFFWAYYYPATGVKTCFHTEQSPAPLDVCCPGNPLCNLIDEYLE